MCQAEIINKALLGVQDSLDCARKLFTLVVYLGMARTKVKDNIVHLPSIYESRSLLCEVCEGPKLLEGDFRMIVARIRLEIGLLAYIGW